MSTKAPKKPKKPKKWGVWSSEQEPMADPISTHVGPASAQRAADKLNKTHPAYHYANPLRVGPV